MNAEFTIKNYRCFSDHTPLKFHLKDGFTSFVGVNNAGKSSILRFFYEFRTMFQQLSNPSNMIQGARSPVAFSPSSNIRDIREMFSNFDGNDRAIEITVKLFGVEVTSPPTGDEIR